MPTRLTRNFALQLTIKQIRNDRMIAGQMLQPRFVRDHLVRPSSRVFQFGVLLSSDSVQVLVQGVQQPSQKLLVNASMGYRAGCFSTLLTCESCCPPPPRWGACFVTQYLSLRGATLLVDPAHNSLHSSAYRLATMPFVPRGLMLFSSQSWPSRWK